MYSASLSIILIAIVMITSLLILVVNSHIVQLLGMVDAQSIVRFRIAIDIHNYQLFDKSYI